MGTFGLIKANLFSVLKQGKLEAALAEGHRYTAELIKIRGIEKILKAGLTPNERRNLDELKRLHPEEMEDVIESAFQRALTRDGKPNLSNAMDQVLIEVAERIKQAREEGEVDRFS